MGRYKTPTAVLELRGTRKNHPEILNARKNEPDGGVFSFSPPEHLTEEQQACWCEIVDKAPAGVLKRSDELQVEIVSVLLAEFRDPDVRNTSAAAGRLSTELARLGMNPTARAGLTTEDKKGNDFAR